MAEKITGELLDAVKQAAEGGKIGCAEAQALAERLGVPMELVGLALDQQEIKIIRCQLGCF